MKYRTEPVACPECLGDGTVTYRRYKRQSFNRDIGYEEEFEDTCWNCDGSGEVDNKETFTP